MTELNEFNPDWVSPPGDTIADLLVRHKVSTREFAQRIGRGEDEALALIHGRAAIDQETARLLSAALGASISFWMNREQLYREAVSRFESRLDPAQQAHWLRTLPLKEMKSYGWLDFLSGTSSNGVQCLRFFGVSSVDAWNQRCEQLLRAASFRTSRTFRSEPGAVAAWLRQGELEASAILCERWSAQRFREELIAIRALTRVSKTRVFFPKLQSLCASCGVAVVVVKAPTKCRASGASWVLPDGRRALLLSTRYRTDDQFWFTFFHEAGHLVLHPDRMLFIDVPEEDKDDSKEEEEANRFALNVLVPAAHRADMLALPVDGRRVMRFAKDIDIAPGIVVGQLQHLGRLTRRQLNNLKQPLDWAA